MVRCELGKFNGRPLTGPTDQRWNKPFQNPRIPSDSRKPYHLACMVRLRLEGERPGRVGRRIRSRGFTSLFEAVAFATGRKMDQYM